MKSIVTVLAVIALVACVNAQAPRFTNMTVLVTGGTSGIGYQTALQFAQEGAHVIIAARDSHKKYYSGESAVKKITDDELVKKNHGSARFFKADMSNQLEAAALFDDIRAKEKILDIAVNAAGISGPLGLLEETSQYSGTVNDPILNNLYSTLNALTGEETIMVKTKTNGCIVNVGSLRSVSSASKMPRYSAASHAIVGLANSVAMTHITVEDVPYIRVNTVLPGNISTPFLYNQAKHSADHSVQPWDGDYIISTNDTTWQKYEAEFSSLIPMARIGLPKEVANTILWLCTEDATYISADTIIIDGGAWAI